MGSRVSLQLVVACIALVAPGLGPAATAQVAPRTTRPSGAPKAAAGAVKATGVLAGIITERHSAGPLPGVTVTLEETGQTVVSGADGGYRFEGVAPGTYHLTVTIESFTPARIEARVASGAGAKVDVALEPDLHYSEVVSVGVRPQGFVRGLPADVRAVGPGPHGEERSLARRAPEDGARRQPAIARTGAVAAGDPRPGRRPRPDPRERPADGRSLQPVGRSRRLGQPAGGDAGRGGARPGHPPLRRQRHRRAGQRGQRGDPHRADDGRARRRAGGRGHRGRRRFNIRRLRRRQRPLGAAPRRHRAPGGRRVDAARPGRQHPVAQHAVRVRRLVDAGEGVRRPELPVRRLGLRNPRGRGRRHHDYPEAAFLRGQSADARR